MAQIRLRYDLPVVSTGGVARAEDVVEMTLAGAMAVVDALS